MSSRGSDALFFGAVTLRRLKWIAIFAAFGFILLFEYVRQSIYPSMDTWKGRLFMDSVIFTGAIFFFGAVFHLIERMQGRLEQQNRELLALHTAALDVYRELALEVVLQKVVDQARSLLEARYGALSLISDDQRISSFVTSGITDAEQAAIGVPPIGKGLLGVVLRAGQRAEQHAESEHPDHDRQPEDRAEHGSGSVGLVHRRTLPRDRFRIAPRA